jgi:hypothetical protein
MVRQIRAWPGQITRGHALAFINLIVLMAALIYILLQSVSLRADSLMNPGAVNVRQTPAAEASLQQPDGPVGSTQQA